MLFLNMICLTVAFATSHLPLHRQLETVAEFPVDVETLQVHRDSAGTDEPTEAGGQDRTLSEVG
jgi:hypothetical protein